MMDAAVAAGQSDLDLNPHFRRRWGEPPPQNRKRPGRDTQALRKPTHHTDAPYTGFELFTQQVLS